MMNVVYGIKDGDIYDNGDVLNPVYQNEADALLFAASLVIKKQEENPKESHLWREADKGLWTDGIKTIEVCRYRVK